MCTPLRCVGRRKPAFLLPDMTKVVKSRNMRRCMGVQWGDMRIIEV